MAHGCHPHATAPTQRSVGGSAAPVGCHCAHVHCPRRRARRRRSGVRWRTTTATVHLQAHGACAATGRHRAGRAKPLTPSPHPHFHEHCHAWRPPIGAGTAGMTPPSALGTGPWRHPYGARKTLRETGTWSLPQLSFCALCCIAAPQRKPDQCLGTEGGDFARTSEKVRWAARGQGPMSPCPTRTSP